jgi:threonine dehydratase
LGRGADGLELYLKLELLQPVRSFKLRGAYNAMAAAGVEALAGGVWTASAGNMAQAVAWSARALGVPATVYVPDTAPRAKVNNVRAYGGVVVELPVLEWVDIFRTRRREGATGVFIHPYSDPLVLAGNAVCGLEITEDLPDVDAVIAPFGGGGLSAGIAAALRHVAPGRGSTPARSTRGRRWRHRWRPGRRSRSATRRASRTGSARRS